MKIARVVAICGALLMLGAVPGFAQDAGAPGRGPGGGGAAGGGRGPSVPGLALTTTGFPDGGEIPAKYTQSVPNAVSPDLEWTNVPASTVSFVLILHDPDTSVQRGTNDILHWMAFNIPGTLRGLPEGVPVGATLPDGSVQVKNMRGNPALWVRGRALALSTITHSNFMLWTSSWISGRMLLAGMS